jgi:anti-sigma B factor antagonist
VARVGADDRPPLTVQVEREPAGATVIVAGELDFANAAELEAVVEPLIAARPALLRFDLAGLRFIDSTGLGLLLRSATRVTTVRVVRPSVSVRRVLEATGLRDVLRVEP